MNVKNYKTKNLILNYNILLKSQNGVCLICKNPETRKDVSGNIHGLVVDHNHETGDVRGLLCHKCNSGLGMFRDNVDLLKNAIKYLENSIVSKEK